MPRVHFVATDRDGKALRDAAEAETKRRGKRTTMSDLGRKYLAEGLVRDGYLPEPNKIPNPSSSASPSPKSASMSSIEDDCED